MSKTAGSFRSGTFPISFVLALFDTMLGYSKLLPLQVKISFNTAHCKSHFRYQSCSIHRTAGYRVLIPGCTPDAAPSTDPCLGTCFMIDCCNEPRPIIDPHRMYKHRAGKSPGRAARSRTAYCAAARFLLLVLPVACIEAKEYFPGQIAPGLTATRCTLLRRRTNHGF